MAQFDVYENRSPGSKARVPYLLDIQHDLLEHLKTRVVIPLVAEERPISHLNPSVEIDGKRWMLSTQEMAGVSPDVLGRRVASLASQRDVVVQAVDFLVTGF
jgi:toxin CcdB